MIMMPGQVEQFESILENVAIGVAILDAENFHIHYANSYLCALLGEPFAPLTVAGCQVEDVLPASVCKAALPLFHYVATTGRRVNYTEVPYEGFLEARGKTYWHVSIEARQAISSSSPAPEAGEIETLLVFVEDVTDAVRSRLHLNAIHSISAAIATGAALPQVLDRILQAMQDMVGSKRCAVFLIEQSLAESEARLPGYEDVLRSPEERVRLARLAAQKGVHTCSYDWLPIVDEHVLLGRVEQAGHALIIADTSQEPEIELPFLIHEGKPSRPGSALCVPIFEPPSHARASYSRRRAENGGGEKSILLGSIEVYHRRARSFPAEEVALLEQFAQQAGLAIQTARLFRSIDRYARVASRNAHQKENVMQAIPDGVVIFDPRWRVADVNHAARKLFGWPDDILGTPVARALAVSRASFSIDFASLPDLAEQLEQRALDEIIEELKCVSAEGRACALRVSYAPIRDELGDLFAFIVIYHDVTSEAMERERIEAEVVARTAELAQRNRALQVAKEEQELSHARMALLLDRMPSGVLLVEAGDNAVTLINGKATHILQSLGVAFAPPHYNATAMPYVHDLNSEMLLRQASLYGPNGALMPYEEQPLYRALVRGEASEAELHSTRTNGDLLYLLVNAAPLRSSDGSVVSAILVLHEISKMKALERTREDFFTTMAHELKTPLANIRAHLSALLVHDLQWSSEEQYAFVQTADEQVERLVRMINQFLDASRVEAGALRLELEPILVPELLEDLQDRLEALISSSGRRLQVQLPPDLPAVRGDYELIMSVLTNLLSNAFRYAPPGDLIQLDIGLIYEAQGRRLNAIQFKVTDRGPGMTREQQTKLFTRFSTFAALSRPDSERPGQPTQERSRSGGRWSPATGLGLYISRGIIEAHGSTLVLKSRPGQGASFSFTLPIFNRRRGQGSRKHAQER